MRRGKAARAARKKAGAKMSEAGREARFAKERSANVKPGDSRFWSFARDKQDAVKKHAAARKRYVRAGGKKGTRQDAKRARRAATNRPPKGFADYGGNIYADREFVSATRTWGI